MGGLGEGLKAVVAIPALDEADRIGSCLSALALQRDRCGLPLAQGTFDVLVLANDCRDETAAVARSFMDRVPFGLHVLTCRLPPQDAHAGGARRAAMDRAAEILSGVGGRSGAGSADAVLLTTDADSRAHPVWVAENLAAIAEGVDAVAGYVDADPDEYLALGAGFLSRGRSEDRYLALVAELHAVLDPRRHDPWPNHRVHSGASFAVTLSAYRAIGGLPLRAVGEDVALALALEDGGFLIRHSMAATVTTSCRFNSRASGGAGDTMRLRHENLEAACDGDMEPTQRLVRRLRAKAALRRLHATGHLAQGAVWWRRLGFDAGATERLLAEAADVSFARLWGLVESLSPVLGPGPPLRPSQLPREILKAERLLAWLGLPRRGDPADIPARDAARPGAALALLQP